MKHTFSYNDYYDDDDDDEERMKRMTRMTRIKRYDLKRRWHLNTSYRKQQHLFIYNSVFLSRFHLSLASGQHFKYNSNIL